MKKTGWGQLAAAAALFSLPTVASADFIATIAGNECGGPFSNCAIGSQYDPNQSPAIIKFETRGNGFLTPEINTILFPSIDGSEFSFSGNGASGTWTYTPGEDDPVISFFVAKGGPSFNLFSNLGAINTDTWSTPINPNNKRPYGLSHLTFFFDQGTVLPAQEIPEPGTLALLGLGLLGLSALHRRNK